MKRSNLPSSAAIFLSYGRSAPVLVGRLARPHVRHRPKVGPVNLRRFQGDPSASMLGFNKPEAALEASPQVADNQFAAEGTFDKRALENRRLLEDAGPESRHRLMLLRPPVAESIDRQSLKRKRCPVTAAQQRVPGIHLSPPRAQATPEKSGVTTHSGVTDAVMIEG